MSTVVPTTITALVILVFFFMPGLVTLAIIGRFKPAARMSDTTRLLKAFILSVVLYANYLCFGWFWVGRVKIVIGDWTKLGVWPYWFLVFVALILVPLLVGILYSLFSDWARSGDRLRWLFPMGHEDSSWQLAFWRKQGMYVKLHLKDGNLVGAKFGGLSGADDQPEGGGIYLENTYRFDNKGHWILDGDLGGYFPSEEIKYMQFYRGSEAKDARE